MRDIFTEYVIEPARDLIDRLGGNMKPWMGVVAGVLFGIVMVFLCCWLTGFGFSTEYYVVQYDNGKFGWELRDGGYTYTSVFTFDTEEEARRDVVSFSRIKDGPKKISRSPVEMEPKREK